MDRRCDITGNECGSDTWMEDYTCSCESCQSWLVEWKEGEGRWMEDDYFGNDDWDE